MNFNFTNQSTNSNRTAFRSLITRKQQLFRRFQRRCQSTKNPSERAFLKNEAGRIADELRMFATQWKKNGFGGNTWVTRGYKKSNFTFGTTMRHGASRRNPSRTRRSGSRRSTRSYRAYVAW